MTEHLPIKTPGVLLALEALWLPQTHQSRGTMSLNKMPVAQPLGQVVPTQRSFELQPRLSTFLLSHTETA